MSLSRIASDRLPSRYDSVSTGNLEGKSDGQAEIQLHFKYLVRWVRSTLKDGIGHGSIHLQHSVEVEAQSFVALVHGAMISAREFGSPGIFTSITKGALERLRASN